MDPDRRASCRAVSSGTAEKTTLFAAGLARVYRGLRTSVIFSEVWAATR
jgi:hypothetical protein